MKLSDLFKQLRAIRVVAESNKKDRAAIEYSVILTVAEYEELEKEAKGKKVPPLPEPPKPSIRQ